MLRSLSIFVALLICLPSTANDAVDKVTLSYVPQIGLTGRIESYGDRLKIQNGIESIEMSMTGSMQFEMAEHRDGVLSLYTDPEFNIETSKSEMKQFLDPILGALSSIEMRAVISDKGEMLRLEGMEPVLATTRKSVGTLIETLPDEHKPMMNRMVEASLSEKQSLAIVFQNLETLL